MEVPEANEGATATSAVNGNATVNVTMCETIEEESEPVAEQRVKGAAYAMEIVRTVVMAVATCDLMTSSHHHRTSRFR